MTDDIFSREQPPLLIVLSGTAGSGKDSVVRRMRERGVPFEFVVTATTRPPRSGEEDGREYSFVDESEFQERLRQEDLLEHAEVYSQHYGIPKSKVRRALDSGKDVLLRIDVQGADTVRRKCPQAVSVFLTAPSEDELSRRLRDRGTGS